MPRDIIAKYQSHCFKCNGSIAPGTLIEYERGRGSWHKVCPAIGVPAAKPPTQELQAVFAFLDFLRTNDLVICDATIGLIPLEDDPSHEAILTRYFEINRMSEEDRRATLEDVRLMGGTETWGCE